MKHTRVVVLEREGVWIGIVKEEAIVDLAALKKDEGEWKE